MQTQEVPDYSISRVGPTFPLLEEEEQESEEIFEKGSGCGHR
jgi:hypothetical protein